MSGEQQTQILSVLRAELADILPDQKLPSLKKLAERFKVSTNTIDKVCLRLVQEEFILYKHQQGYFRRAPRQGPERGTLKIVLAVHPEAQAAIDWALQSFQLEWSSRRLQVVGGDKPGQAVLHDGRAPRPGSLGEASQEDFFALNPYLDGMNLLTDPLPDPFPFEKVTRFAFHSRTTPPHLHFPPLAAYLRSEMMQGYFKLKGIGIPLLRKSLVNRKWDMEGMGFDRSRRLAELFEKELI